MNNAYFKMKSLWIMLLFLFSFQTYGQTYTAKLLNDTLSAGNTVYEFDIYLLRTGGTAFEMSGCQVGLTFTNSICNGGTLTAIIIPGTCTFSNSAQAPSNPGITTVIGTERVFKLASKAPPGAGSGSIISNVGLGTRVGRFRLTNTVPFGGDLALFAWSFDIAKYLTRISAYVGGTNTEITNQTSHTSELTIPSLPVELTSFTADVDKRNIQLGWVTETEINTANFIIERKGTKDADWKNIGQISALGNANTPHKYEFEDKKLNSGKYSYRLKIIDFDGSSEFSDIVETEIELPKTYGLSQNYPNPFNPSTRVDYQLPSDSRVTLEVYSMTGEKIGELVNQDQSAGYYTVDMNSYSLNKNLASGVYIYRMTAQDNVTHNNFINVKKMMMLK